MIMFCTLAVLFLTTTVAVAVSLSTRLVLS